MNHRSLFLTVWGGGGTENPRLRCWEIWCLVRALFLVHRWPSSLCVITWWGDKERVFSGLLYKGTNPLMRAPPPWPSHLPKTHLLISSHSLHFSSVAQACLTLCNPIDCSMPGFHVLHCLPEFAQTHVHWVGDAIQSSHPLSPPSPPAFNLSKHQGLFQWVSSSHQLAKVLELQLQHQSFQWIFRTDFF